MNSRTPETDTAAASTQGRVVAMSDQVFLVERDGQRASGCGRPKDSVLDKISYCAMGFVLVGLVFAAIGFLYPRDIQRDPDASARENEEVDQEFMRLTEALNAIIITGEFND